MASMRAPAMPCSANSCAAACPEWPPGSLPAGRGSPCGGAERDGDGRDVPLINQLVRLYMTLSKMRNLPISDVLPSSCSRAHCDLVLIGTSFVNLRVLRGFSLFHHAQGIQLHETATNVPRSSFCNICALSLSLQWPRPARNRI